MKDDHQSGSCRHKEKPAVENSCCHQEEVAAPQKSCCHGEAKKTAQGDDVHSPEPVESKSCCQKEVPKPVTSCCQETSPSSCCDSESSRPDYLLWISGGIVALCYLAHLIFDGAAMPVWLQTMSQGIYELVNRMWWGLLAAVLFVGLLERVPRELVMQALGKGGTLKGIGRATLAGLLLDLCSHGILMVGAKLYERGASLGQLMAFLIASPWNSLSLTVILIALIGWKITLAYILLSMLVGIVAGLIFDALVSRGNLPGNPISVESNGERKLIPEVIKLARSAKWNPASIGRLLWDGLKDSRMVFRWLFFGLVLATAIRAFVPLEDYQTLFGPTILGLLLTLVAATIIEVCSEGSTPIAADLVTRAAAPGNGFAFLMAGISTDYTEIMVLRDLTKSWKIALFLPLVTLPQVLVLGWLLNQWPR